MSLRPAQRRATSLLEAGANVLAGYLIALIAQQLIYPAVGIEATLAQEAKVAAAFTVASLLRSYTLRRLFERSACWRAPGNRPECPALEER
jgi:hypothetical protein